MAADSGLAKIPNHHGNRKQRRFFSQTNHQGSLASSFCLKRLLPHLIYNRLQHPESDELPRARWSWLCHLGLSRPHPQEICHVPGTCNSRFCSVCAKVQIDKRGDDIDQLFPKCPYFHRFLLNFGSRFSRSGSSSMPFSFPAPRRSFLYYESTAEEGHKIPRFASG